MTPKFKRIFIIEVIALVLSLLPIATMYYVSSLGETVTDEMYLFYTGLNSFIVYPILAVIVPTVLALFRFESYLCCLPVAVGFILGNFLFIQLPILNALLYAVVYAAVGLGLSALILRLRRTGDETKRVLGR